MQLLLGGLLWVSVFLLGASESAQHCPGDDGGARPFVSFTRPSARQVLTPGDGLGPLYSFSRAFLKAVQPNPFPEAIVSKALKNEQQDIPTLVRYEAGYLVCLVLAVLYLLLMPIAVGVLLRQHFHSRAVRITSPSSTPPSRYYKDIAVSGCLILITLLLLIGVILAFTTNSRTRANLPPSLQHLDTNVGIMEDSLRSVPLKMEAIVEQYNIPKSEISKTIQEADDAVRATIVTSFSSEVQKALTDLSSAVKDAIGTTDNLNTIETTRPSMQRRHSVLQIALRQLQARLDNLNCPNCDVPASTNLETDADYTLIPSVQDKLDSMPPRSELEGLVEQGNSTFRGIPQFCSDQIAPTTAALISELNETQKSLMNTSQSFPSLQSFTEFVSQLRTSVRRFEGPIDYYDYIRWAVAVTLCFVMLVIVLLMVAALSMGLPVLFNPTIYSSFPNAGLERTALSLFQASMILSCAFSWLFIILVFVTLFFGGNAYTLGCQSFTSGQLFTFLDHQENLFSLNVSQGNDTTQIHPSVSAVYQGCMRGSSMFHSMNMNQQFDLADFLNSTKYLKGFSETAGNMRVDINDLKLLSDKDRRGLLGFRNLDLESYNYDMMLLLLSKPVVKRNLSALAEELDEKAELPENTLIKADLQAEAAKTRSLHDLVRQQRADAANMTASVKALRDISRTYKANVDKTLNGFSQTEAAMHAQVPYIVANVSQCTLEKAEQCLLRYLDWVRHAILDEIMGCHWLVRSVENVYTAICLNVIDPWNAFWLCLGWCCAFLVPEILLSVYIVRRVRPNPPTPIFIGKDQFILEKKQHMEENPTEKTKSNIYMTLEELHNMNVKDVKMKGQSVDT
ncbi:prominin-2-like [Centroberyx affinis]|uniref:prominin-2-like n=1 Tax=Centroberyx affinis TaxID=166261 RepID=UPI003A5C5C46